MVQFAELGHGDTWAFAVCQVRHDLVVMIEDSGFQDYFTESVEPRRSRVQLVVVAECFDQNTSSVNPKNNQRKSRLKWRGWWFWTTWSWDTCETSCWSWLQAERYGNQCLYWRSLSRRQKGSLYTGPLLYTFFFSTNYPENMGWKNHFQKCYLHEAIILVNSPCGKQHWGK